MPAPQKEENKNTTICITKHTKQLLRRYAIKSSSRKGNESDNEVLTRILSEFIKTNVPDSIPRNTYE